MLALVVFEAVAIALLGLLVAGLLRSHAEILRRLHHLGAGDPTSVPRPAPPPTGAAVRSLTGVTTGGEVVSLALDRVGERTLLLFLSSGCTTCASWWEGLRAGAHTRALPGTTVIVVARDAEQESVSTLGELAPDAVSVVLASAAWDLFSVPGSPYAVLIDGSAAAVMGEGVARSWEQLGSLVGAHLGDVAHQGRSQRRHADDAGRTEADLLAAGVGPGHPSLHPPAGGSTARP